MNVLWLGGLILSYLIHCLASLLLFLFLLALTRLLDVSYAVLDWAILLLSSSLPFCRRQLIKRNKLFLVFIFALNLITFSYLGFVFLATFFDTAL